MLGLSITAIGRRPFNECLSIYQQLKPKLKLNYLEIAIGSSCDLRAIDSQTPLVVHDEGLYRGSKKLRFSLTNRDSWVTYRREMSNHNVLLFSVHSPKVQECSFNEMLRLRSDLEDYLGIKVIIEVMPTSSYILCRETVSNIIETHLPILLDVSHVNLWTKGDTNKTEEVCNQLMQYSVGLHLSHNDGKSDRHELVREEDWFNNYLKSWEKEGKYITYEALPQHLKKYQRLDRC